MALPYWIETILSLSAPAGGRNPGRLASQVGVEYNIPIVPPGVYTSFIIGPQAVAAARGLPIYMIIQYQILFGNMVPGAFELTITAGGINAYDGTLSGNQLINGVDTIFFHEPDVDVVYYITNLTAMNQYYQSTSSYLIVQNEKNYNELKSQLEKMQFPYGLPEPLGVD